MNGDNAPHTVTSRQEGIFDSSLINPANSWVLNSAEIAPAEYEYYYTSSLYDCDTSNFEWHSRKTRARQMPLQAKEHL